MGLAKQNQKPETKSVSRRYALRLLGLVATATAGSLKRADGSRLGILGFARFWFGDLRRIHVRARGGLGALRIPPGGDGARNDSRSVGREWIDAGARHLCFDASHRWSRVGSGGDPAWAGTKELSRSGPLFRGDGRAMEHRAAVVRGGV